MFSYPGGYKSPLPPPQEANSLHEAYDHLREGFLASDGAGKTVFDASSSSSHNEEQRIAYNADPGGEQPVVMPGGVDESGKMEFPLIGFYVHTISNIYLIHTCVDKRRICELVALRGEGAVRMIWGTIQEPSSIWTVLSLFPKAVVEEVRGTLAPFVHLLDSYGIHHLSKVKLRSGIKFFRPLLS